MEILSASDAYNHLSALVGSLTQSSRQDSEQEVQGIALPVLCAVIEYVKTYLHGHPVVDSIDVVTVERIASGEPIRAVDALLVANQLIPALPTPQRPPEEHEYEDGDDL